MEVIIAIGFIVFIILFIREKWIKFKRQMHIYKRSIIEVEDPDMIEAQENILRNTKNFRKQMEKDMQKNGIVFCANCGTPVETGVNYCPQCGTRIY